MIYDSNVTFNVINKTNRINILISEINTNILISKQHILERIRAICRTIFKIWRESG